MAMSSVISKASITVVPLTLHAIASPRILSSIVIKSAEHGDGDTHKRIFGFSHQSNFSTVSDAVKPADHKLKNELKSQINSFDPSKIQVPEAPTGFPVEIKDIHGERGVKLTREFAGEKIVVNAYEPVDGPTDWVGTTNVSHDDGGAGDNSSTDSSDNEEPRKRYFNVYKPHIQVNVDIIKESGTKLSISCWANVGCIGCHHIFIEDGSGGCNNVDLANEEDYWREFIRVRGIDDSIGKFMMDYFQRRKDRRYLLLLKKLSESL